MQRTHMQKLSIVVFSVIILSLISTLTMADTLASHITWDGYLRGESISNMHGGLKTGTVFNCAANLIAIYDQQFYLGVVAATHTQNQNLYTDPVQGVSSLVVQGEIRLGRFFFETKSYNGLKGRIGIMDMEDYYDITESAIFLRNSAFVNAMALDKNAQLVSFPYPGFGAMVDYQQDSKYIYFGLFQSNPEYLHTVFQRGYMLIGETGNILSVNQFGIKDLELKAGLWTYQTRDVPNYSNSRGLYLISQIDWLVDNHHMNGFLQFAYSNEKPKYIPYSITVGTRSNNIFSSNDRDWLSFGIGKVWIANLPSEVVFELSYVHKIYKDFFITPDLQYFIRPSGTQPNATVFLLRISYMSY